MNEYDVLILGGGTAGITVAARLSNKNHFKKIAVVEPSETHYYQPLWTLVGNGLVKKEITAKPMKQLIPNGVEWIKQSVTKIDAQKKEVHTSDGIFSFKYLVVATGILADWERVPGLASAIGKNGVCSVYDYRYAEHSFETLKELESGDCLFTMPAGLLKCGGAPQKIMWLSEDYVTKYKDRSRFNFQFIKEGVGIFGVKKYKKVLQKMVEERGIQASYNEELTKVDGHLKNATFKNLKTNEERVIPYDILHVVPHFKTHDFLIGNEICNNNGEVDVDKYTLQGTKFPYIFSLGDCSSCPTGKTGAAIRKEAPVLVENLISFDQSKPLVKKYNGYTACPILTRRNRVILAEFDYDGNPDESFPFDQSKERFSMYLFKRYLLPWLYWNFMMKGHL